LHRVYHSFFGPSTAVLKLEEPEPATPPANTRQIEGAARMSVVTNSRRANRGMGASISRALGELNLFPEAADIFLVL
jgi:hypothetical protein